MESEEASTGLDNPNVVNKYREAASIVGKVLENFTGLLVAGADIASLCTQADSMLEDAISRVFTSQRIEKGIAFPTCISVNNICAYFSPFPDDSYALQEGDMVKVDMGVQIDGYVAQNATTVVVQDPSAKVTGEKADLLLAALNAMQAALRLIRPGNTNTQVTEAMSKIAEAYGCTMLEGILSHETKQHVLDGNKVIIGKEAPEQYVEEFKFEPNQAFIMDVIVSNGEGKPKETEYKPTVYQRALDVTYNLKLKASRSFFSELNRRFPTLCFTLRAFSDPRTARLGVAECLKHNLLHVFPVLAERPQALVAQFKATVLILENETLVVTPLFAKPELYETEKTIEDADLKSLLETPMQTLMSQKKKKPKKKKKKAAQE